MSDAVFHELFDAGAAAWDEFRALRGKAFHAFVPADYVLALDALRRLRPRADSFLELGAGVGVVAITAALIGYESAGIEIDPTLVGMAEDLAERFEAQVTFGEGSFVPEDMLDAVDRLETEIPTVLDDTGHDGFAAIDADISDFDLVYAFPWPGTEPLFFELVERNGRPDTLFLTYGGTDDFRLWQGGQEIALP